MLVYHSGKRGSQVMGLGGEGSEECLGLVPMQDNVP